MRTRRRHRGFSLLEVTVAVTIIGGLLVLGGVVLRASGALAQSSVDEGTAAERVQRCLLPVATQIRQASLSTIQGLDGTAFSDGETDTGIRLRKVVGFEGSATLAEPVVVRLDRPSGSPTGTLVLVENGLTLVLARQVTDFEVTRSGTSFTLRATARSGPEDDRERTQTGRMIVRARNP